MGLPQQSIFALNTPFMPQGMPQMLNVPNFKPMSAPIMQTFPPELLNSHQQMSAFHQAAPMSPQSVDMTKATQAKTTTSQLHSTAQPKKWNSLKVAVTSTQFKSFIDFLTLLKNP